MMGILAAPLIAGTLAGILLANQRLGGSESRAAVLGLADLVVSGTNDESALLRSLPDGSETLRSSQTRTRVTAGGYSATQVDVERVDLTNRLVRDRLVVIDGAAPSLREPEAALTPSLAHRLRASIGDTVELGSQGLTATITALIELPADLDAEYVVVSDNLGLDFTTNRTFVDVRPDDDAIIAKIAESAEYALTASDVPVPRPLGASPGVLTAIVVVVTAVATQGIRIVSSKEIGSQSLLRALGISTPLRVATSVGSLLVPFLVGIVAGPTAATLLAYGFRPRLEELLGHRILSLTVPVSIVLAVVAASVFAVLLASVLATWLPDTVRRGPRAAIKTRDHPPTRATAVGSTVAVGAGLLVAAVGHGIPAVGQVAALVLVFIGARGVVRSALHIAASRFTSIGNRFRAGDASRLARVSVVAAVPIGILASVVSVVAAGDQATAASYVPRLRDNWAFISEVQGATGSLDVNTIAAAVEMHFPDAKIAELQVAIADAPQGDPLEAFARCADTGDASCYDTVSDTSLLYIGDRATLETLGANGSQQLEESGVVVLGNGEGTTDLIIDVYESSGAARSVPLNAPVVEFPQLRIGEIPIVVVSPRLAEELELRARPTGVVIVSHDSLTDDRAREQLTVDLNVIDGIRAHFETPPEPRTDVPRNLAVLTAVASLLLTGLASRSAINGWKAWFLVLDPLLGGQATARRVARSTRLILVFVVLASAAVLGRLAQLAALQIVGEKTWTRAPEPIGLIGAVTGVVVSGVVLLAWRPPRLTRSSELQHE